MKTKTAKSEWLSFAENCIPSNAPDVQIKGTQMAFYMGIVSAMNIICSIDDDVSEDEAFKIFGSVFAEAQLFVNALSKTDK